MGRQIAVSMSPEGEAGFLAFLHASAPVRLFRSVAASHEQLAVEAFSDWPDPTATFLIWNTTFGWSPQFYASPPEPSRASWVRIANHSMGPLLEYSRSLHPAGKSAGRIYWPKVLPHPNPCAYDVESFSRWYEQVVGWVKRTGRRGSSDQGLTYILRSKSSG